MSDIEPEDIENYFTSLKMILSNSFKKIPITIWAHPFLQEIEQFYDQYWDQYLEPILNEVLPICANKGIAIELSADFHRNFVNSEKGVQLIGGIPCYKRIFDMLSKIYKKALVYPEIKFSFASDAHHIDEIGDIFVPRFISRILHIPTSRLLYI
jgi:histidinol phosphatase-like PHP family hydrolase